MDCILRLVAMRRAHPFAHLGPMRAPPGPDEALLEIPIAAQRLALPACCAAEIRVLAFRTPAEQAAALAAANVFLTLGDDWSILPADVAPHAWTVVLWRLRPDDLPEDRKGWIHVDDLRSLHAESWAAHAATLSPGQRLALLEETARALVLPSPAS